MIRATLYRENGRYTGCRLQGHSGYDEPGRDIICAAVSILSCTCVNSLESVCGLPPAVITGNEEGLLSFELPEYGAEGDRKAQILMGALKQGLTDLTKAYPKYLKVIMKNGGKDHDQA